MIWAFAFGLCLGGAIFFVLGTAYGVRREQDRLIELGWRRMREERRAQAEALMRLMSQ